MAESMKLTKERAKNSQLSPSTRFPVQNYLQPSRMFSIHPTLLKKSSNEASPPRQMAQMARTPLATTEKALATTSLASRVVPIVLESQILYPFIEVFSY